MAQKKGLLERLSEGPVVGDGSMCFLLEKRGYAKSGMFTPEAVIDYPEAVLQLHREYVRSGADVVQTASFYASDDKLAFGSGKHKVTHTSADINKAACELAKKAASENNCLVAGGFSPVPSFRSEGESAARKEFSKQVNAYAGQQIDFVIAEFFHDIREIELCASEMKKLNIPVVLCMRIGLYGDVNGISVEECAIRMAKAGADVIGTNCAYDSNTSLKVMKKIKAALNKEKIDKYLICQPVGFLCPEAEGHPNGFYSLPEFPICLDPRIMTRIEAHKFAREAWNIGVNYIGGCCGFEPHHIRSIAEELSPERKRNPPVHDMARAFGGDFFKNALSSTLVKENVTTREHWDSIKPGSGRPFNPTLSTPYPDMKFL